MEQATCKRCGVIKPFAEFNRNASKRSGLDSWCRECHRASCRATRRKYREDYNGARRLPIRDLTCERCGTEFQTPKERQRFCSEDCRKRTESDRRRKGRPCSTCGEMFHAHGGTRYCSDVCAKAALPPCRICGAPAKAGYCSKICAFRARPVAMLSSARRWYMGWCKHCGEAFVDPQPHRDFCTPACKKRHHNAQARRKHRQRRTLTDQVIYRRKVYERDNWTCQLCGKKVTIRATQPWHPMMPTLDHVIPRAKGGAHAYSNVQLAHFICNSLKSDGLFAAQPEQLRLVG